MSPLSKQAYLIITHKNDLGFQNLIEHKTQKEESVENNMNTTLLIMVAGIGSRFGTEIKQLEPVDDANHIILNPRCDRSWF